MRKIVGVEIVLFMVVGVCMGIIGEVLKRGEERIECEREVRVWSVDGDGDRLVGGVDSIVGGVYVDCELVRDRRW